MVHRLLTEVEIYWLPRGGEGAYIPKPSHGFAYGAATHVLMDTLKRVGVDKDLRSKIFNTWLEYQSFYADRRLRAGLLVG